MVTRCGLGTPSPVVRSRCLPCMMCHVKEVLSADMTTGLERNKIIINRGRLLDVEEGIGRLAMQRYGSTGSRGRAPCVAEQK